MGTRCTIKIQGITYAKVYKHWDGYPEHILPWLIAFNAEFTKDRGDDPQYKWRNYCGRVAGMHLLLT